MKSTKFIVIGCLCLIIIGIAIYLITKPKPKPKPNCSVDKCDQSCQCPPNKSCYLGLCRNLCKETPECPPNQSCDLGVCKYKCDATSQCQSNQSCDLAQNICIPNCSGDKCDENCICPPNQSCESGVCHKKCEATSQCPLNQTCDLTNNLCYPVCGEKCDDNCICQTDGAHVLSCNPENHKCEIPPGEIGAPCDPKNKNTCLEWYFCGADGFCRSCTGDDSLCGPGRKCINGICIGSPCTTAPDNCTDGKICDGGNCVDPLPKADCSYSWKEFTNDYVLPDPSPYLGGNSNTQQIPSGVLLDEYTSGLGLTTNGKYVEGDGTIPWGIKFYYGLQGSSACPTKFQSTTDLSKSLQFNGVGEAPEPVCWDFNGNTNSFSTYNWGKNACNAPPGTPVDNFKLILKNPLV